MIIAWIPTHIQKSFSLRSELPHFYHVANLCMQVERANAKCTHTFIWLLAPVLEVQSSTRQLWPDSCRWPDSITHLCFSVYLQSVSLWLKVSVLHSCLWMSTHFVFLHILEVLDLRLWDQHLHSNILFLSIY